MAVITKLPAQNIIDGFRGTLDYYCWGGLVCVRAWPRSPGHDRAPEVEAQWPAFTYINQMAKEMPTDIIDAYKRMASGTSLTWRDMMVRCYLKGDNV